LGIVSGTGGLKVKRCSALDARWAVHDVCRMGSRGIRFLGLGTGVAGKSDDLVRAARKALIPISHRHFPRGMMDRKLALTQSAHSVPSVLTRNTAATRVLPPTARASGRISRSWYMAAAHVPLHLSPAHSQANNQLGINSRLCGSSGASLDGRNAARSTSVGPLGLPGEPSRIEQASASAVPGALSMPQTE